MAVVNDYPATPGSLTISQLNDGSIIEITITNSETSALANVQITAVYEGTSTYVYSEKIASLAAGDTKVLLAIDGETYDPAKLKVALAFVH